jgi:hypothetical protein
MITPEMVRSRLGAQVQIRFRKSDTIKSGKSVSQVYPRMHSRFAFHPTYKEKPRLLSIARDKGSTRKVVEVTVSE